jgi:hypothetical protein
MMIGAFHAPTAEPTAMLLANDEAHGDSPAPSVKQLRSLAIILHDEFGVHFRFFDAATGHRLEGLRTEQDKDPAPAPSPVPRIDEASLTRLIGQGVAEVQLLQSGYYQLALPFAAAGQPATVAVGVIAGLTRTPAEMIQERARLARWLHSVHLRLCAANQATARKRHRHASDDEMAPVVGLEALMSLEQLLRAQRLEKTPAKNRRQVLQAAARVLRAQAMLWAPARNTEALIEGEALLSPSDGAQLARLLAQDPEGVRTGYLRVDRVQATRWAARFPRVTTLLAVPVPPRSVGGWLIALNKSTCPALPEPGSSRSSSASGPAGEAVFRRTDAALLLPFAALLGAQRRASRQYQKSREALIGLARALATAVDARAESRRQPGCGADPDRRRER